MSASEATKFIRPLLIVIPAAGIVTGFLARWNGHETWSAWIWGAATLPVLAALLTEIIVTLRRGDVGLDIVAALSMTAALVFGEPLAAVVVALMYAGGQYLEDFAERHARREMTALLARLPRTALRHKDGGLEEVDLDFVIPGDKLLIRQGDVVPVDGAVADGSATLDQSALTGEPMPVHLVSANLVMSGSTNVGQAFDLIASHPAAQSTYAGIVRLVEAAQHSKAPMSRIADRFALVFLAAAVVLAGAAWLWTGDPIRAVAVLVVATPCPLIIAVPVAIISGISRAAKHGILVKSGKAMEALGRIRALVIDKTGTLTVGHASLVSVQPAGDIAPDTLLRLAASLDQASKHIIAQTLVAEAASRKITLQLPTGVSESPGEGIEGEIDGRQVIVGGLKFVRRQLGQPSAFSDTAGRQPGSIIVGIALDRRPAGTFVLADPLRIGSARLFGDLRRLGIERIVLATGDRRDVADSVAAGLPIDLVRSELTPDQKILVVMAERKNGPVMMVGDGVNDAPALAAADVGIAMGARGAAASAEAADVVLLVDELDRIRPAITIARRARRIALESVYVGIGLSIAGMIAAAFGIISPVQGALIQEAIDVAVILNALRALVDPTRSD